MLRSVISRKNERPQQKTQRYIKTENNVKKSYRVNPSPAKACCGNKINSESIYVEQNGTHKNVYTETQHNGSYKNTHTDSQHTNTYKDSYVPPNETIKELNNINNSNAFQILDPQYKGEPSIDLRPEPFINTQVEPVDPVNPVISSRLDQISDLKFENAEFIYTITGDIYDGSVSALLQSNGDITDINPQTKEPSSIIHIFNLNLDVDTFLFSYDGIRSDYQYAQMKFLNNGDIIILSSYTGKLTFIKSIKNNKYINIDNIGQGSYFLARFNMSFENKGELIWLLPITALGMQNIEMTLDMMDNIYLTGTYQNIFKISESSLTSSLVNDMFLTKITPDGTIVWLRTSDKSIGQNSSTGVIRAESIIFNLTLGEERITAIGQYNSTFKYSNIDGTFLSVTNIDKVSSNLWVAQFDLNGNIIWMNTPTVNRVDTGTNSSMWMNTPTVNIGDPVSQRWYITGYQIVFDFKNSLYITGTLLGDYTFNPEIGIVGGEEDLIYVSEISTDGKWMDYTHIRVSVPRNEVDWYPHLLYNDKLYISLFGLGDIHYGNTDIYKSTGNLTLWINALHDKVWQYPYSIQANVSNPSINLISQGDDVIVVGSCIITPNNTNGYVKKMKCVIIN